MSHYAVESFNEEENKEIIKEFQEGKLPYGIPRSYPCKYVPDGVDSLSDFGHFAYYCYFVGNGLLMPDWRSNMAKNYVYIRDLVNKGYLHLFCEQSEDDPARFLLPEMAPPDSVLIKRLAMLTDHGQGQSRFRKNMSFNLGLLLGKPDTAWMIYCLKRLDPEFEVFMKTGALSPIKYRY